MLTVWGRRTSFNVQKVLWLIGELGLPYRHIAVGGEHGSLQTPAFAALNPTCRIPVIDWDGDVVWESHTILRYLAARVPNNPFWCRDAFARSRAERWMDWSQTALEPDVMTGLFWALVRTPPERRDDAIVRDKAARSATHYRLLDRLLSTQPFLGGATPGLADIPAGATLFRYFSLDVERPPLPHVEAWYARLCRRPAYREQVMVSFDALRGQPG
jgi:glutathione S-transferase